jgi:endonuclease G
MSYHRDRGIPNWVSWHLDSFWLGSAPRQDDFRPDPSLPEGWYRVTQFDYSGSGFDRGHHTPSADRTRTVADNSATFLMTNIMPQAPANNQGPWEELESYCRTLVSQGNELYIIAGGAGMGGSGSNGGITNTIAGGRVTVPAVTWKVIVVIPNGDNDLQRVDKTTRTIAVIMPNRQDIGIGTPWRNFRVSIRAVEALTGFNFLSNVSRGRQLLIERRVDTQ